MTSKIKNSQEKIPATPFQSLTFRLNKFNMTLRCSSLSSSSSQVSDVLENSDDFKPAFEESASKPTLKTLTQCLHQIHALSNHGIEDMDQNEAVEDKVNICEDLFLRALGLLDLLREDQLKEMPFCVRKRALQVSQNGRSHRQISAKESHLQTVTFLLGRCFNMSMNVKILQQCGYADPNVAAKLLTDMDAFSDSLQSQLTQMTSLDVTHSALENLSLKG